MSGYCGWSKSNNAVNAEYNERYPITQASKVLAKKLNWSQVKARQFLENQGTGEYHHTSKYYNETLYYDVSDDELESIKDDIKDFIYIPKVKKEKEKFFKCWNYKRSDIRGWDWSITVREGNHTMSLRDVKEDVERMLKEYKSIKTNHKTQIRIKDENIASCKYILKVLKEEKQDKE